MEPRLSFPLQLRRRSLPDNYINSDQLKPGTSFKVIVRLIVVIPGDTNN